MKFNTDSHFVIGRYHIRQNKPCQDHARDCSRDGLAVAVVSDGCSSGGHTDIGARVITCSAIRGLTKHNFDPHDEMTPQYIKGQIQDSMITAEVVLDITNQDLLATCSYVIIDEAGGFVHLIGDGCVAIKYKNGDIDMAVINWQNNTPYYLAYGLSNTDSLAFENSHKSINEGKKAMEVNTISMSSKGEDLMEDLRFKTYLPFSDGIKGYVVNIKAPENIECIAIFSDGIQDFQMNENERVSVEKVVHEMMSFKNYTGEFVKRRVSAGLKKFAKDNIHPSDDFSMAVVHIDHETTESL